MGNYELIINWITINEATFQVQTKTKLIIIYYYLLLPKERKRKERLFTSVRREIYDNIIEE